MLQNQTIKQQNVAAWFTRDVLPLEPALVRYLNRNWRNPDDVRDFVQEIYIRAYEAAANEVPRAVKPFLFAIARNLIIDRVRKNNIVSIEAVADFEALNVIDSVPSPELQTSAREELRLLQRALDDLPPRCRQVVVLRKVEGLSQREVAGRLGVSEEVIESQTAKAMRLLSQSMRSHRPQVVAAAKRFLASRRQ